MTSFFAPYACDACGREESLLIDAVANAPAAGRARATPDDVPRVRRADGVQRLPRALLLVPVDCRAERSVLEEFANFVQDLVSSLGYPGVFLLIVLESTLVPIPSKLVMPFAGLPRVARVSSRYP